MGKLLLRRNLFSSVYIAIIFVLATSSPNIIAQTVLLPGDIVIVTANASTNTADFIPLIDIEKNSTIYFSSGRWNEENQTLTGDELRVDFDSTISAGTNIHLNAKGDERYRLSGELNFEGEIHHLFAYQKEQDFYRFVYGLGWGKPGVWNADEPESSDIPQTLLANKNYLLTLGRTDNIQYHLRNGASGTRNMLLGFVSNPANWRSRNKISFPSFGTSFNLLVPPVVLFDQSVSVVNEDTGRAVLNVAIYEHDGSRLTVNVEYDSLRSVINKKDIDGFSSATLNFTGLIGNGVYEVDLPVYDDDVYEGNENGIFNLSGLSDGNYGDFITHTLIIRDNEQPELQIVQVFNNLKTQSYIEIQNAEEREVDLSGWSLNDEQHRFEFDDDYLLPGESLKLYDYSADITSDSGKIVFGELFLKESGGELQLQNAVGEVNSRMQYEARNIGGPQSEGDTNEVLLAANYEEEKILTATEENAIRADSITTVPEAGWYFLPFDEGLLLDFAEIDFYTWIEAGQKLVLLKELDITEYEGKNIAGYFSQQQAEDLSEWLLQTRQKIEPSTTINFELSATDFNENELIDGVEGFNLVHNTLNKEILVQTFIARLKELIPTVQHVDIYEIERQNGRTNYIHRSASEFIRPNASFWVALKSPIQAMNISIEENQLAVSEKNPEIEMAEESELFIHISNDSLSDSVGFSFSSEVHPNVLAPDSYPELSLKPHSKLGFYIKQGNNHFNKIHISDNITENLQLPVSFQSAVPGRFKIRVSEWDVVPKGFELKLEDKLTDQVYNLRKDFELVFEHELEEPKEHEEGAEVMQEDYERFVLHIEPSVVLQKTNDEKTELPKQLELFQNYPNPFNPLTTISFYLPEAGKVKLSVFNIVGQPVSVLVDGNLSNGQHHFDWDATDRPSGMYIYQLEVGKKIMTRKMTLVK